MLWSTGGYTFDARGSIAAIGGQAFRYGETGALTGAQVLPQSKAPGTPLETLSYTYDARGNMTSRTSDAADPAAGLEFTDRFYTAENRVEDPSWRYDANGRQTRFPGQAGQPVSALWSDRGRLTAFVEGDADAGASPSERYLYDGSGLRVARVPVGRSGEPTLSLRGPSGRVLAEFRHRSGEAGPVRVKEFVYGLGQLLVERTVSTGEIPAHTASSGFDTGSGYAFELTQGLGASSYTVDIPVTWLRKPERVWMSTV